MMETNKDLCRKHFLASAEEKHSTTTVFWVYFHLLCSRLFSISMLCRFFRVSREDGAMIRGARDERHGKNVILTIRRFKVSGRKKKKDVEIAATTTSR
jgi:hypothetical protein